MTKKFNITGICYPEQHYMVDISDRVAVICKMIAEGDYICINRGRQYGKTTTLQALRHAIDEQYSVFMLSFEGMGAEAFSSLPVLCYNFMRMMSDCLEFEEVKGINAEAATLIKDAVENAKTGELSSLDFASLINRVCKYNGSPIVLVIDEVDQAGNYESFVELLGIFRKLYLNRKSRPTFQSVILAGVYDIKNLKLQMRTDDQHQYNSPWNISVQFEQDMSLSTEGIAAMIAEYANDHGVSIDAMSVAQLITDYTSGYPFLVSRFCMLLDENHLSWDKDGVLTAEKMLLSEHNTLFDDMVKKLDQFPEMKNAIRSMLFEGNAIKYNPLEQYMQLGERFSFFKEVNGQLKLSCRIFETVLYELLLAEENASQLNHIGSRDKSMFARNGELDMPLILSKFAEHFNAVFRTEEGSMDVEFLEKTGRKQFLLFIRPIINGVGHYYVESETRDETRTDLIIDYAGKQYVIEMKIWHGNTYNEQGETQLAEYLDCYGLKQGYLLSFCFNKGKNPGLKEPVYIDNHILTEVIV